MITVNVISEVTKKKSLSGCDRPIKIIYHTSYQDSIPAFTWYFILVWEFDVSFLAFIGGIRLKLGANNYITLNMKSYLYIALPVSHDSYYQAIGLKFN